MYNKTHNQDRDLKDFAKRMYSFGRGRGKNRLWDLQVIPPIIGLGILLLLFVAPIVFLSAIIMYALIVLYFDLKIFLKAKEVRYLFSVPVVFSIEHLSYSIGFWAGIVKSLWMVK